MTMRFCNRGHYLTDPANVGINSEGFQYCRACNRAAAKAWRERKRKEPPTRAAIPATVQFDSLPLASLAGPRLTPPATWVPRVSST